MPAVPCPRCGRPMRQGSQRGWVVCVTCLTNQPKAVGDNGDCDDQGETSVVPTDSASPTPAMQPSSEELTERNEHRDEHLADEALRQEDTGGDFVGCPQCKVFLGQLDDTGQLNVVCARCRYRYYFRRGTLVDTPVHEVASTSIFGVTGNQYSVVLAAATGENVALPHEPYSPRVATWLSTRMGQPVTVVHTVRRGQFEELVAAIATAEDFAAKRPGRRGRARAFRWAFVAFSGTALFALAATNALAAMGLALVMSWAAFVIVSRRTDAREQLSTAQITQLEHGQELIRTKVSLVRSRDSAADDVATKVTQAQSWADLSQRMAKVNKEAYALRIQNLDRVCRLLEEQASVHRRLVSLYDKAIAMTDIEMESSRLEELGPGSSIDIASKVEDLKEELRELERQFTANTEVDRLLGGPELGL